MAFRMAAEAKLLMEETGYTFVKRDDDGYWQAKFGAHVIKTNRSLGDLIREMANIEGAW